MRVKHLLLVATMLLASCDQSAQTPATPFEYRALCTPTNNNPTEFGLDRTHNVDNDWGLWGHNLWKVIGDNPPEEVYAMVEGKLDKTQYCFSSQKLYDIIVAWIADQWGPKGARFTIMPADNKKVCMCDRCRAAGNTRDSATPAVAAMLERLAARYPGNMFFMTAYHTTRQPPTKALPRNAGVMISTMDIPMCYSFNHSAGYRKFDTMLRQWKKVTPLIYVWEYDRNFDDYLTPYPCLLIMQQRLKYYHSVGVRGVFVNGSGYDYSTFDDLQSYVLAKLLLNVNEDVEALVKEFYKRYYPKCGEMIASYYLALENRLRDTNSVMPYYGTIDETIKAYLDPKEFVDFWVTLDRKSKTVSGKERTLLNRMLTAMAYTRLMLKPAEEDREEMILILKDYKTVPGLLNYKETNGSLKDFLKGM